MKLEELFEGTVEWRPVKDFPAYEVSNTGKVRVKSSKRILAQQKHFGHDKAHPYMRVMLHNGEMRKNARVHRLVALAFHGEPPSPGMEVDHKDIKTTHNKAENLEWVTSEENRKRKQGRQDTRPT